jgi:hypothetical protein
LANIDTKQYGLDVQHRSKKSRTKEQWENRLRGNFLKAEEKGCREEVVRETRRCYLLFDSVMPELNIF